MNLWKSIKRRVLEIRIGTNIAKTVPLPSAGNPPLITTKVITIEDKKQTTAFAFGASGKTENPFEEIFTKNGLTAEPGTLVFLNKNNFTKTQVNTAIIKTLKTKNVSNKQAYIIKILKNLNKKEEPVQIRGLEVALAMENLFDKISKTFKEYGVKNTYELPETIVNDLRKEFKNNFQYTFEWYELDFEPTKHLD